MADAINGDLSTRAVADTTAMDWSPSPSASVWRKRVHLVGPPESGQVTSVVRYEPRSKFPAHDHPEGEEILVLDGVFSDEHGDWPVGTYLLNPEGFRHAPFSDDGCVLLVKLRQFQGRERNHVVIDTQKLAWEPTSIPGVARKMLYEQSGFSDRVLLERLGCGSGSRCHPLRPGRRVVRARRRVCGRGRNVRHWLLVALANRFAASSSIGPRMHALRQAVGLALSKIGLGLVASRPCERAAWPISPTVWRVDQSLHFPYVRRTGAGQQACKYAPARRFSPRPISSDSSSASTSPRWG